MTPRRRHIRGGTPRPVITHVRPVISPARTVTSCEGRDGKASSCRDPSPISIHFYSPYPHLSNLLLTWKNTEAERGACISAGWRSTNQSSWQQKQSLNHEPQQHPLVSPPLHPPAHECSQSRCTFGGEGHKTRTRSHARKRASAAKGAP